MTPQGNVKNWVMVVCDFIQEKPLETYAGFCVMRIDDKNEWTNEAARFYEGDPAQDFQSALAYADSLSRVILRSRAIDDFWKRTGLKPKEVKRG
jgi:hypothetical protein